MPIAINYTCLKKGILIFEIFFLFLQSSKSEPYDKQLQEERILELHAKCDSYESELTRFRKENDDLIKQLYQMQQV